MAGGEFCPRTAPNTVNNKFHKHGGTKARKKQTPVCWQDCFLQVVSQLTNSAAAHFSNVKAKPLPLIVKMGILRYFAKPAICSPRWDYLSWQHSCRRRFQQHAAPGCPPDSLVKPLLDPPSNNRPPSSTRPHQPATTMLFQASKTTTPRQASPIPSNTPLNSTCFLGLRAHFIHL